MVDKGDAHLQRMGLTKLTKDDTFVEHDDEWEERVHLQNKIKTSNLIDKKPVGNLFETSETPDNKVYVSCHLTVPIMVISADAWPNREEGVNGIFKRSRAWAHIQRSRLPGGKSNWESLSSQGHREIFNSN